MFIFLGTFKIKKTHGSSFHHIKQFVTKINSFYDQNHQQQQPFLFMLESNESFSLLPPRKTKKI